MYSRGLMLLLIVIMLAGCSDGGRTAAVQLSGRAWIDEQELEQNQNLHVQHHQTVALVLKDTPATNGLSATEKTVHQLRYYLAKETMVRYALDTDNPCIKEIVVDDLSGKRLMTLNQNSPNGEAQLKPDRYLMTVTEVSPLPQHCSKAFIYSPQPVATTPVKGIATSDNPDLYSDDILRLFGGNDSDVLPYGNEYYYYAQDTPGASNQYEKNGTSYQTNGLIRRYISNGCMDDTCGAPIAAGSSKLFRLKNGPQFGAMLYSSNNTPFGCYSWGPGVSSAQYMYRPYDSSGAIFGFVPGFAGNPQQGCYIYNKDLTSVISTSPFHFSLYQGSTNFDFTFIVSGYFCDAMISSIFPGSCRAVKGYDVLESFAASVATDPGALTIVVGTNTQYGTDASLPLHEVLRWHINPATLPDKPQSGEAILYTMPNYQGQAIVLNSDTDYTKFPIGFPSIGSIRLAADTTTVNYDTGSKNGRIGFDTADLTSLNLKGYTTIFTLFKAIDVVFSNSCPGCNLQGINLSGYNFDNRDFTGTNFIDANLNNCSLQKSLLTGALLQGANLNYANLTSAILLNSVLYGGQFNNANLDGAKLCNAKMSEDGQLSASFSKAFLRNALLANAQLAGVNFSNANIYSDLTSGSNLCQPTADDCASSAPSTCASLNNAVMSNTNFSNAFLANVDFGSAQIYGTIFSNAILINANFKGASIGTNPTAGSGDFLSAWLHSADFTSAQVANFNLSGAWVNNDYLPNSATSCYLIQLGGSNTQFTGYWGKTGQPACIKVKPARNTVTPTFTDSSVVCPDGSRSPCNSSSWKFGVPDPALFSESLHCTTLPTNCTVVDTSW